MSPPNGMDMEHEDPDVPVSSPVVDPPNGVQGGALAGGDSAGSVSVDGLRVGDGQRAARPGWLPEKPRERGVQKQAELLRWICRFHYSNVPVLMELLDLTHFTNSSYFKRQCDRGLLKRVDIPTLRRPVLMLSASGLSLLEGVPEAATYHLDDRRISPSLARHSLSVQRAVLRRKERWFEVQPERLIKERGKKVPDALLTGASGKTALEIELNYKTAMKIYLGFADHARAIRDGFYQSVEYVFADAVMAGYYRKLFEESRWPVYRWNEKTRHYDRDKETFAPSAMPGLCEAVTFSVEEFPHD